MYGSENWRGVAKGQRSLIMRNSIGCELEKRAACARDIRRFAEISHSDQMAGRGLDSVGFRRVGCEDFPIGRVPVQGHSFRCPIIGISRCFFENLEKYRQISVILRKPGISA